MTNRWGATAEEPFNLLPNFGFGVLFMPFSGREGFGSEFFRALADDENFGQLDVEEGAQVARYLIEHDYVQPEARPVNRVVAIALIADVRAELDSRAGLHAQVEPFRQERLRGCGGALRKGRPADGREQNG